MSRFQSTLAREGTASERLRGHFAGLRRLAREEPELFATMAELTLRAPRDRSLAAIIQKTNEYWEGTLRAMLRAARDDGDLPKAVEPEGMASVIVATLKGVFLLPGRARAGEGFDRALRQLERLLGLRTG